MSINKKQKPPKFRGQNQDRGYFPQIQKTEQLPERTRQRNYNEINPDTGEPYVRIWRPD